MEARIAHLLSEKEALFSVITLQQKKIMELEALLQASSSSLTTSAVDTCNSIATASSNSLANNSIATVSSNSLASNTIATVSSNSLASNSIATVSSNSLAYAGNPAADPVLAGKKYVSTADSITIKRKVSRPLDVKSVLKKKPTKPALKKRKLASSTVKYGNSEDIMVVEECSGVSARNTPKSIAPLAQISCEYNTKPILRVESKQSARQESQFATIPEPISLSLIPEQPYKPRKPCTDAEITDGILGLSDRDSLDIFLTRCFKKLCKPDRLWRVLFSAWRKTDIIGIPVFYKNQTESLLAPLRGRPRVDFRNDPRGNPLDVREENIVSFIWFLRSLSPMMAKHLAGFGEGSIYKHAAHNQSSLLHDADDAQSGSHHLETLLLQIFRDNECIKDPGDIISDYSCVIYRNILHVWPMAFGSEHISFSLLSETGTSLLRNAVRLLLRMAIDSRRDHHIITTCLAIRNIYECAEEVPTSLSILAFNLTVRFCDFILESSSCADLSSLLQIIPAICHQIPWNDTLWGVLARKQSWDAVMLVSALARQGCNVPRPRFREHYSWIRNRFIDALDGVGDEAVAEGLIDMAEAEEDWVAIVWPVLEWWTRNGEKCGSVGLTRKVVELMDWARDGGLEEGFVLC